MSPLKFLSFTLKAYMAIIFHLYKIDILKLKSIEKSSTFESSASTFIVVTCVACLLSKINLSPYIPSISNLMVYILELTMTIYGTELIVQMIWIPILKALFWTCSKIGKMLMRKKYKSGVNGLAQFIDQSLFCYLNFGLALLIASNTLGSFGYIQNIWPLKSIVRRMKGGVDVLTEPTDTEWMEASIADQMRPKKKHILLRPVR